MTLDLNPEFQRHLWLEFTLHRLIAMPLVLGLIFLGLYLVDGRGKFDEAGAILQWILLVLWGSRLAADAVPGEVAARTWDGQRLSAIAPWSMCWGKLAGSTLYAWYGAACCLPAIFASQNATFAHAILMPLTGLMAQAVAMLVALLGLRAWPQTVRLQTTLAQVLGIVASTPFQSSAFDLPDGTVSWYGTEYPVYDFILLTQLMFLAWAVAGVYRLMRRELQLRGGPWVWLGFVVFVCTFAAGFRPENTGGGMVNELALLLATPAGAGWAIALMTALVLTYFAAFAEPKSWQQRQYLWQALRSGHHAGLIEHVPSWLVSGLVALVAGAATAVILPGMAAFVLACLAFAVRDIALIYVVAGDSSGASGRRGHLTALIYLGLLYGLLPWLLTSAGLFTLLSAVVPDPTASFVAALWPIAEAAALLALLRLRLRAR